MSEPAKKIEQAPGSYSPKAKPEIIKLALAQAQNSAEGPTAGRPMQGGSATGPTGYDFHFSSFRGLDFTNCFTALYLYLEGIEGGEGSLTLANHAVQHFFLFDTVSGRSATVRGWDNRPTAVYSEIYDTDGMVDFVMGYAGYVYEKHSSSLMEHIRASLEGGVPVLARLKKDQPYTDAKADSFRLITGYRGNRLMVPAPKGAQKAPKKAPKLGEIDCVYAVTGRARRRYTLPDALRRIEGIMERDREAAVWDEYIRVFEEVWERCWKLKPKEFNRLLKTAYKGTTWNCHNFVETFRTYNMNPDCPARFAARVWDELKDPRLEALSNRIDAAYHNSWSYQWQLRLLQKIRKPGGMDKYSMCGLAVTLLRQIKACDEDVCGAVCEMIETLEESQP